MYIHVHRPTHELLLLVSGRRYTVHAVYTAMPQWPLHHSDLHTLGPCSLPSLAQGNLVDSFCFCAQTQSACCFTVCVLCNPHSVSVSVFWTPIHISQAVPSLYLLSYIYIMLLYVYLQKAVLHSLAPGTHDKSFCCADYTALQCRHTKRTVQQLLRKH